MNRSLARSRGIVLIVSLFAGSSAAHAADEIEILSLSPTSPANLDGISESEPAVGAIVSATNSITVVVRYRSEGAATTIEAFSDPTSIGRLSTLIVPPTSPVAPCGALSGPSSGTCSVAFTLRCPEGASDTARVERVGVALGIGSDVMTTLATDRVDANYTFVCPGTSSPPRRSVRNCMVVGTADEPGESELPIAADLPLCRCLRDDGAREYRCGILHSDFFLLRRVPLPPLVAGGQTSEEWSFLPLTALRGPVRVVLAGEGLARPYERLLGANAVVGTPEAFSVPIVAVPGSSLEGRALVAYETAGERRERDRKFELERSVADPPHRPR